MRWSQEKEQTMRWPRIVCSFSCGHRIVCSFH
jgi:hypothetical protein